MFMYTRECTIIEGVFDAVSSSLPELNVSSLFSSVFVLLSLLLFLNLASSQFSLSARFSF